MKHVFLCVRLFRKVLSNKPCDTNVVKDFGKQFLAVSFVRPKKQSRASAGRFGSNRPNPYLCGPLQSWMHIIHVYSNDPELCALMSSPRKGRICLSVWLEPVSTKTRASRMFFFVSIARKREEYIFFSSVYAIWSMNKTIDVILLGNYWCEFYTCQFISGRNRKQLLSFETKDYQIRRIQR
jgi:hypothetical protein